LSELFGGQERRMIGYSRRI